MRSDDGKISKNTKPKSVFIHSSKSTVTSAVTFKITHSFVSHCFKARILYPLNELVVELGKVFKRQKVNIYYARLTLFKVFTSTVAVVD